MTDRLPDPPGRLHAFPLPRAASREMFSNLPGFRGITERDGKWMVDLDGPPALSVAKEIVRRIKA